ncbi:MAG: rubredoxin [Candidatus Peribacteria bacterium]|nr:MAG: rubredoxin [Candidatus Peribacteria bacterium]
MRYHCTECSYIYDESLGDSVDGIEAGTKAEELSQCPACDAEDSFYPITEEVNYFDEKSEYIPLIDAEHYPIVEVIA